APLPQGEGGRAALITLSVILFNLAGFYGNADRYDDAVKAMEEVVAIDEQTGHQDLESDRKMLETFRRIASLSPEERAQLRQQAQEEQDSPDPDGEDGFEAQLQAQLAELPPERRAEVEAQIRKAFEEFQRMTPEEKAAKLLTAQVAEEAQRRKRVDQYANQARDAGLAYFRKQAPKRDVLNMLEESAAQMKANEKPGSPWLEVAALCLAIAALIKEESMPPVPAAYASHFSAVESERQRMWDKG
ncbi:MAG TPA: hypothetical protein VJ521_15900, partial [Acidobacteriota bacterium]|nr:hypothetical protein [Acidobacteriota bacterium]